MASDQPHLASSLLQVSYIALLTDGTRRSLATPAQGPWNASGTVTYGQWSVPIGWTALVSTTKSLAGNGPRVRAVLVAMVGTDPRCTAFECTESSIHPANRSGARSQIGKLSPTPPVSRALSGHRFLSKAKRFRFHEIFTPSAIRLCLGGLLVHHRSCPGRRVGVFRTSHLESGGGSLAGEFCES